MSNCQPFIHYKTIYTDRQTDIQTDRGTVGLTDSQANWQTSWLSQCSVVAAVLAAADGDAGSRVASPQSAQHIVPYRTVPLLLPPFAPPPPWLTSFCLHLVIRLGHFWLSCIFMICLLPLFRIFTTSQRDRLLPPKLNNSHVLLSRYPGRS